LSVATEVTVGGRLFQIRAGIPVTLLLDEMNKLNPSVFWCCWLGSRKGIWPVNKKAVLSQRCPRNMPWHFWQICTIRQYVHRSLLESPFVPSSTDCWAVRVKKRQKRLLSRWP